MHVALLAAAAAALVAAAVAATVLAGRSAGGMDTSAGIPPSLRCHAFGLVSRKRPIRTDTSSLKPPQSSAITHSPRTS
jgi:hypothetical protein